MSNDFEDRFHLNDFKLYAHLNRFMEHNNIELVELETTHSIVKHFLNENSVNINGTAHGGLMMTMMDIAASTLVRKNGDNCATLSMNTNFLRKGVSGMLYAKAEFIKRGKTVNVIHAYVYDEADKILCDSTISAYKID